MRSFVLWIAILGVAATARSAHADAAAKQRAARALFDAQVHALGDNKLDAFANAFLDSDHAAAMFPSSRFVAVGRKGIRNAAAEWAGARRSPTSVKVIGTPIVGVKPDDDATKRSVRLVVVTGDLEITLKNASKSIVLRMTEVYSDGLDPARPNALVVAAAIITEAIEDKNLRGSDVTTENSDFDRFLELLRFPDLAGSQFDGAPDDLVLGSSASEKAQGPAAAKLLKSWASTKFAVVGKPQIVGELDWVYVLGTVSMTRGKGKPAPLNVLLAGYAECLGTPCVGKDLVPHVVALHFGQAR